MNGDTTIIHMNCVYHLCTFFTLADMCHYFEETLVWVGIFKKACPLTKETSIRIRNIKITAHHGHWRRPWIYSDPHCQIFQPNQEKEASHRHHVVATTGCGATQSQPMVAAFPFRLEKIISTILCLFKTCNPLPFTARNTAICDCFFVTT